MFIIIYFICSPVSYMKVICGVTQFSPNQHWLLVAQATLTTCKSWMTLVTFLSGTLLSSPRLVKETQRGFPGGAVVENLPANAGDTGLSPGLGRSHMPRSSWARESQLLSLCIWSLCSATREAAIVRGPCTAMKSGPPLATTRGSPRTETKTQHSHTYIHT